MVARSVTYMDYIISLSHAYQILCVNTLNRESLIQCGGTSNNRSGARFTRPLLVC